MKRFFSALASRRGFPVAELTLTIAILSILVILAQASYETLKAGARYAQMKSDMNAIAQAAYTDYTTSNNNTWPLLTFNNMPPSMMASGLLSHWPNAPCPGWYYSWEDWTNLPTPVSAVSVTLRRSDNSILFNYCLSSIGDNCYPNDPMGFGGTPTDIASAPIRHIYCTE